LIAAIFFQGLPPMKLKTVQLFLFTGWNLIFLLPVLVVALAGCAGTDYTELMKPQSLTGTNGGVAVLHVGDTITITLDGLPTAIPPMDKTINEDGTVTLTDIGPVPAAGKTSGELEKIIHDRYVPQYYTHLNVTVKVGYRDIFVSGEVKQPGRQPYIGPITLTRAITAAGDFTDFANRKKVWLTRFSSGKRYKINCDAILNGDAPDPPVYPGDQIQVDRRKF
jgi:polysaccharide biosynthesis/export protein VpsN